MNQEEKSVSAPEPLGPIDFGAARGKPADTAETKVTLDPTPCADPSPQSAADGDAPAEDGTSREPDAKEGNEGDGGAPAPFDPNPYGDPSAPPPTVTEAPKKTNGLSTAALITGLLSHVLNVCCCLGLPLAIAAIVCAVLERGKSGKMSGLSLAGLILGILSIASLLGTLLYLLLMLSASGEAAEHVFTVSLLADPFVF